ncbi:hypothetical protein [Cohnella sp. REN36]|uniref:hypothetical protein n=1 Tax=Cohnella sp. REN36 TaxID=2887347 RepID=UPI001D156F0A|nr:hypothetical protein [Cohnella sp. REN36]MCC3372724.1 hypothetical protein [Cohnella sp. REN36]
MEQNSKNPSPWTKTPLADEARAAAFPHFKMGLLDWRNADIRLVGDIVRQQPETVIDVQSAFEGPDTDSRLGPDGIHPSIEGHYSIARQAVARLAGGAS